MAEILVAFGVAANIVQFIDFSSRILTTSYRMYESGTNTSQENLDLKAINLDLLRVIEDLGRAKQQDGSNQKFLPKDVDLQHLAERCRDVGLELSYALDKITPHSQAQKWSSFSAALKTVWKEGQIDALKRRLENLRQEIVFHLMVLFRDEMAKSTARQTSMIGKINEIGTSTQGLGEIFLTHIERSKRWQEGYLDDRRRWQADLIAAIYQDPMNPQVRKRLNGSLSTERESQMERQLLESLYFSEMGDRQGRITEAHEKTFQWIYRDPQAGDRPWTSFVEWLESDSTLYWITGKAGSGKSTLVKYLYSDARTFSHLETWASGTPLITASFFFWNGGTDIQTSQNGLMRTILFQIFKKSPALIPLLLPERWEVYSLFGLIQSEWSHQELRQAFRLLSKLETREFKFCFFIDGLDEFKGDQMILIDLIREINFPAYIKICVSSRPWVIFEDVFQHKPSLRLEHLTYPDIKQYIDSMFHDSASFGELENREPQYALDLLHAIAQKACGVFLWVHLVVRSLLAGLVNGDRVSDLQRRLELLPPDLEDLYEKMLNSLDPFYFEHAAQYFQIVRAARLPPTLLCLSFADEEPDFVEKCKVKVLEDQECLSRANIMRRRLNSRCKGLLEVGPGSPQYDADNILRMDPNTTLSTTFDVQPIIPQTLAPSTVQYLHKTVKDYLESPKVWYRITEATQNNYNPYLALCQSLVIQLKALDPESLTQSKMWRIVADCLDYARIIQENTGQGSVQDRLIGLLDELDRAANELVNLPDRTGATFMSKQRPCMTLEIMHKPFLAHQDISQSFPYSYWTSTQDLKGRSAARSFISLAVRSNLRFYVEAKVKTGCLVIENRGPWPLLADAIDLIGGSSISYRERPKDLLKMIRLLLTYRADPNWAIGNTTVWEKHLDHCYLYSHSYFDSWIWMEAVYLFLQHGAVMKADFDFALKARMNLTDRDLAQKIQNLAKLPWSKRFSTRVRKYL